LHPLVLKVNLDLLKQNFTKLRTEINDEQVKIMAVIKSNAYGHGSIDVAKSLENEADYFGVGLLEEAIELREAGIEKPILIMGPTYEYEKVAQYSLTMSIISVAHYKECLNWAEEREQCLNIHLKVDTGMHRFGLRLEEIDQFIPIYNPTYTKLEGVYSHFATTYKTKPKMVHKQKAVFDQFVRSFNEYGFDVIYHLANSENAIDYKESRYQMVRIGNALYGPCNSKRNMGLKTIGSLQAKIVAIQEVKKGESVGYGLAYKAKKDMKIAVLPFGFYEGSGLYKKPLGVDFMALLIFHLKEIYRYLFRNKTNIYFGGQPLPIIGRPNMQFTLVGLTMNTNIEIGDELDIKVSPIFIKDSIVRTYSGGH
jgi:alanine racemase